MSLKLKKENNFITKCIIVISVGSIPKFYFNSISKYLLILILLLFLTFIYIPILIPDAIFFSITDFY